MKLLSESLRLFRDHDVRDKLFLLSLSLSEGRIEGVEVDIGVRWIVFHHSFAIEDILELFDH